MKNNIHYGIFICPECGKHDGNHGDDCTSKMLGIGIKDKKQKEKMILSALGDEME